MGRLQEVNEGRMADYYRRCHSSTSDTALPEMGKTDSTLMFFLVQMVIFLLACVVIAMVLGIKRKIKK